MAQATQEATEEVTQEQAAPEINPKDKIPGLQISYENAALAGWTEQYISALQMAKQQFPNINAIEVADAWYIIRSLNRREYRTLVQTQAGVLAKEMETAQKDGNDAARATLPMISEEAVAVQGCLWPQDLNQDNLRNLPAGVATTLHDAILEISGYTQNPVPIKV